jgi:hypothetical protein
MFHALRLKWREVYLGGNEYFERLLELDDDALMAKWQYLVDSDYRARRRQRYRTLYREFFAGKNVFEIGSGIGGDGVHFLRQGASWTFSDITEASLQVVRRICNILGLHAAFVHIDDHFDNITALTSVYDVIWSNLAMNPIPFELAREECLAILARLKPGGRWIEISYGPELFERTGRRKMDWETASKGEGEHWQELYDLGSLKRRLFPAPMETILDYNFSNDNERHFDLLYADNKPFDSSGLFHEVSVYPGESPPQAHNGVIFAQGDDGWLTVTTLPQIWSYAISLDLSGALAELDHRSGMLGKAFTIDLTFAVDEGYIGILAVSDDLEDVVNEEEIMRASSQPVNVLLNVPPQCRNVVFRNAAGRVSRFHLKSARLLR